MSERQVGNWIRAYIEYTKEFEAPDSYHLFIALHTIASVLRRNVWLNQGIYVVYPNVFIALVGPPGKTGKSTALHAGSTLLHNVPGIKFGPSACSRESLIEHMVGSKLDDVCALTISSSEFSSIVDVSGLLMFQFLTDIYDGNYTPPEGWKYTTKNVGKYTISNPVLNMIVGTTPDYLADCMPSNVIGHGFTARLMIVSEEEPRLENPLPNDMDSDLRNRLITDLCHISTLKGEFQWSEGAQELYKEYYHEIFTTDPSDYRLEGFHFRKKVHVLKLAMILSASERDDLTVTVHDIQAAIDLIKLIEPRMHRAFSAVGKNEHASDIERIGAFVAQFPEGVGLGDILRKYYHAGSYDDLMKMLTMLSGMGTIRIQGSGENARILPGHMAKLLTNGNGK